PDPLLHRRALARDRTARRLGHTEAGAGAILEPLAPSPELMEIFRAPRVTLIARPEFLEPEHLRVQWRGDSSPGERLAEFARRICYMSQQNPPHRSTPEYIEKIKTQ